MRTTPKVLLPSPTAVWFSVVHAEGTVHLRQNNKAVAPQMWVRFSYNSITYTNCSSIFVFGEKKKKGSKLYVETSGWPLLHHMLKVHSKGGIPI